MRVPIPMVQAWRPRTATGFQGRFDPGVPFWVTKSSSGVVTIEGVASGVAIASSNVVLGTLPVGYRPATEEWYTAEYNGGRTPSVVRTNGEIVSPNPLVSGDAYLSLSNVMFLEASVASAMTWTTPALLNSFTAVSGATPQWAVDSHGDVWLRGRVQRASAWADSTAIFNIPAPYRASEGQHHSAQSQTGYGYASVVANGDITARHSGTVNDGFLSLAGMVYSPASLDSSYSLMGADYSQAYGDIPFQNSWNHYGFGWRLVGVRKRSDGLVMLRGLVASGSIGAPIFWLPRSLWPAQGAVMREAVSVGVSGRLDVRSGHGTDGARPGPYAAVGSNSWFSLDGACWQGE